MGSVLFYEAVLVWQTPSPFSLRASLVKTRIRCRHYPLVESLQRCCMLHHRHYHQMNALILNQRYRLLALAVFALIMLYHRHFARNLKVRNEPNIRKVTQGNH